MENYKNSKIGQETAQKYGDIIEMERPQTEESLRKHPRMTLQNRAKIFSPFAALRGYDEQLAAEKQRTERVPKRILTEEEMSALSDRLMQVTKGMTITVRYFKEDTAHPEVPAVGNYITLTGKVDRIDPVFRTLQVGDTWYPLKIWWNSAGRASWTLMCIWASGKNETAKNTEREVYWTPLPVK